MHIFNTGVVEIDNIPIYPIRSGVTSIVKACRSEDVIALLSSTGTVYTNFVKGKSGNIRNGFRNKALIECLHKLGLISEKTLLKYKEVETKEEEKRALSNAASSVLFYSKALGIEFNDAQLKHLESCAKNTGRRF